MSRLQRRLDRFMAIDGSDVPAIQLDLEWAASQLNSGGFPDQSEL
jgi:hypothetical protein